MAYKIALDSSQQAEIKRMEKYSGSPMKDFSNGFHSNET